MPMTWHWHRWQRWITTGKSKDEYGYWSYIQYRDCGGCGKRQVRYAKP